MPRFHRALPSARPTLLLQARDDAGAFAEFYEEMYDKVLSYLVKRTFDPEVAFDLTAESFARAFAMRLSFRGTTDREAYAWMWTIVRNQLTNWYERGRVEKDAMWRLGIEPMALTDQELERVEELTDLPARRAALAAAMSALSAEQRDAVQLRVLDEMSYAEIAAKLAVSEDVVRSRVSRGLRGLALSLPSDTMQPDAELAE